MYTFCEWAFTKWLYKLFRRSFPKREYILSIAFEYKNTRKTHDKRQLSPYMQVVAACKFNECCNYHFLLDAIPVAGIPVNHRVIRQGEFCHKCELVKKRHMIDDTHAIINEQLKKTTISDYHMTQYTSMSKNYKIGGNLTLPQTKDALRKLRSEKN